MSLFDNRLKGQVQSDGCSVQVLSPCENILKMKKKSSLGSLYCEKPSLSPDTVKTGLKHARVFWSLGRFLCSLPSAVAVTFPQHLIAAQGRPPPDAHFISICVFSTRGLGGAEVRCGDTRCWMRSGRVFRQPAAPPLSCSPCGWGLGWDCGRGRGGAVVRSLRLLLGLLSSSALPSWRLAIFFFSFF